MNFSCGYVMPLGCGVYLSAGGRGFLGLDFLPGRHSAVYESGIYEASDHCSEDVRLGRQGGLLARR